MIKLLKREFQINIGLIGLALVFPFLTLLTMRYDWFSEYYYALFSYYSLFMIGLAIIGAMKEHNVSTEALFLSLPIHKDDLLKSRYIAYAILSLIFNILLYIAISIATRYPQFEHIDLNVNMIVFSTLTTIIVLSILMPLLYRIKKRHGIFTFAYIMFTFTIRDIIGAIIIYRQGDIDFTFVNIILLVIAAIAYGLSFYLNKLSINRRWVSYDKAN